jgi:hypothetical protein
MNYYYTFVTLLFVLVVASILDPKVPYYISLQVQLAIFGIKKLYLMAVLHPRNIFTTWRINRRIKKLTKQLQEEIEDGDST